MPKSPAKDLAQLFWLKTSPYDTNSKTPTISLSDFSAEYLVPHFWECVSL